MKTIAQRMTKRMEAEGRRRTKASIYAVAADDHNVHCLTEAHLDTWWDALSPEDKGALYELHLDGILDRDDPAQPAPPASNIRAELVASAIVEDCFAGTRGAIAQIGAAHA
jgi:hypothetical protein